MARVRYQQPTPNQNDPTMEKRKWWAEYISIYKDGRVPRPPEYYLIGGKYASCREAKEAAKHHLNLKASVNPRIDQIRIKCVFGQEKAKEKHLRNSYKKF